MAYNEFAYIYDELSRDVDYAEITEYLMSLFKKHGCEPQIMLDAACGTGNIAVEFAGMGVQVIGVDMSPDMLSVASVKSSDVLWINQDLRELDLYGTVNSAICTFDSINHIIKTDDLYRVFEKISLFTEPSGIFIFDVNTSCKHKNILGNNTFIYETENVYLVWHNKYNKTNGIVDITLDGFIKSGNTYKRFTEEFSERVYSRDELTDLLNKTGFTVEAVYGFMTEKPPAGTGERDIYVARKK